MDEVSPFKKSWCNFLSVEAMKSFISFTQDGMILKINIEEQ